MLEHQEFGYFDLVYITNKNSPSLDWTLVRLRLELFDLNEVLA